MAHFVAVALLGLSGGCSPDPGSGPPRDAGVPRDSGVDAPDLAARDASLACMPGTISCRGNTAVACTDAGQPSATPCAGATPVCAFGVGCAACIPGNHRCGPSAPNTVQTCAADGMSWRDGEACNVAGGDRCVGGVCTNPCNAAAMQRSYLGCEYWPVTLGNARPDPTGAFPFAIAVANPNADTVTVTIDGGELASPITRTIAANSLETVQLPWVRAIAGLDGQTHSVLQPRGAYRVRTDEPVTVYQFNPLVYESTAHMPSYSNDASLLLPTSALGQQYTVLTYPNWREGANRVQGGTVTIVGVADTPTTVRVRLSAAIVSGAGVSLAPAGATQEYTLNRGDVVQLGGSDDGDDMTATAVTATGPVAVYAGHAATNVPSGRAAADHLEEQSFPDATWGRRYAVTPFADRPGVPTVVRVLAQHANTRVTFDPPSVHDPVTLDAQTALETFITSDAVITGDQPILVAEFMEGQGLSTDGAGDPAMAYAVPVEQYRTEYTFLLPATYTRNFVNIVGTAGTVPVLNGTPIPTPMRSIGASGLAAWSVELRPGVHHLGTTDSAARFGIMVYGVAPYTSYAYPGGLDLRAINPG